MDADVYLRFVAALVFVLGLMGLIAWVARRAGLGGRVPRRVGRRRLDVVEVTAIDAKRRLVLVRRDDVEHLILLGTGEGIVIESGIQRPAAPEKSPDKAPGTAADLNPATDPRPDFAAELRARLPQLPRRKTADQ